MRYAGLETRLLAFIVDFVILGTVNTCIVAISGLDTERMVEVLRFSDTFALYNHPYLYIPVWLYCALFESHPRYQATFGKYIFKLKVVNMHGGKISFGKATGRFFARLLSFAFCGIGFIMILFNKRKQGSHDQAAGTYVVYQD